MGRCNESAWIKTRKTKPKRATEDDNRQKNMDLKTFQTVERIGRGIHILAEARKEVYNTVHSPNLAGVRSSIRSDPVPPEVVRILINRYLTGMSWKDTARRLKKSESAIKNMVYRYFAASD